MTKKLEVNQTSTFWPKKKIKHSTPNTNAILEYRFSAANVANDWDFECVRWSSVFPGEGRWWWETGRGCCSHRLRVCWLMSMVPHCLLGSWDSLEIWYEKTKQLFLVTWKTNDFGYMKMLVIQIPYKLQYYLLHVIVQI